MPGTKPRSHILMIDSTGAGAVREGILQGLGLTPKELRRKPVIGVVNSWNEANPGHKHLNQLAQEVKYGVYEAGGIPMEVCTVGPCDSYGGGNFGGRYLLPLRDIVADSVEAFVRAHHFDAMVTLSSCDKINPGMLMAAARLDIPTICVTGGSSAFQIRFKGDGSTSLNFEDYGDLEHKQACGTCATAGSCEIMGTANTLQCLMEAMGMALPGTASIPAFHSAKAAAAREAGRRIVGALAEGLTARKIMTPDAMENAVMVGLALGGSTNIALHLPAIAHELGVELPLERFNDLNRKIPTLAGITPNGPYGMVDFHAAGGVVAVMKRLEPFLHKECMTVAGRSVGELLKTARPGHPDIIRPVERPWHPEGGLAVLCGSLAPEGAVVKQSAVVPEMLAFRGPAVVFEGEMEALKGLQNRGVPEGSVIVIRYEGPRGGPGMPELLTVTMMLKFLKYQRVALVTDGRFSGMSSGPVIGHVAPEAAVGGPIALVEPGDVIAIDVPRRTLNLEVAPEVLGERRKRWRPLQRELPPGYIRRYARLVGSASKGAVLS